MSTLQIPLPPPRVPVVDARFEMSRPWYYYMEKVQAQLGTDKSFLFFFKETSAADSPLTVTNAIKHILCTEDITIILQDPTDRDDELIITNEGDNTVTFVGTVNGDTSATIDFDQTSIRLRPIIDGYKIV